MSAYAQNTQLLSLHSDRIRNWQDAQSSSSGQSANAYGPYTEFSSLKSPHNLSPHAHAYSPMDRSTEQVVGGDLPGDFAHRRVGNPSGHQPCKLLGPIKKSSVRDAQGARPDDPARPVRNAVAPQSDHEELGEPHGPGILIGDGNGKNKSDKPDGNIYRGWAVGANRGMRQRIITLFVLIVQMLGPLLMCQWAWVEMGRKRPVPIWVVIKEHELQQQVEEMELKLLGIALMILLYFNADQILSNKEVDALRLLHGILKERGCNGWILIDAVCNSWVVAVTAPTVPALLWTGEGVKDIILDAFGLLFLYNLDNYSGDIDFGVTLEEFDDHLPELHGEVHCQSTWEAVILTVRSGNFMFVFARMFNLVVAAYAVPAFALLNWNEHTADEPPPSSVFSESSRSELRKHWFKHGVMMWPVVFLGTSGLLSFYLVRAFNAWKHRHDSECRCCFWRCCFRGHDPRPKRHRTSTSRSLEFNRYDRASSY